MRRRSVSTPEGVELRRLARGGRVFKADVVEAASRQDSPLHKHFTWDNDKAAHDRRLDQAGMLIQTFWFVEPSSSKPTRLYVSLKSDRAVRGGYRTSTQVLRDPAKRAEWFSMALDELEEWGRMYAALEEAAPMIRSIDQFVRRNRLEVAS